MNFALSLPLALSIGFGPTPKPGPALSARIAVGDCGVYVSPWDRHDADYASPKYVEKYHAQIKELLSGDYGEIFEMWVDADKKLASGKNIGIKRIRTLDRLRPAEKLRLNVYGAIRRKLCR